ncbi:AGAP3 protein, partial [Atractosteus spatula]|nr:AGAP3 protein [Atractosteus spatula]
MLTSSISTSSTITCVVTPQRAEEEGGLGPLGLEADSQAQPAMPTPGTVPAPVPVPVPPSIPSQFGSGPSSGSAAAQFGSGTVSGQSSQSGPPGSQFVLSNSAAIRAEIQRFESVHPNIYAIYDLIERIDDLALQNQIREHVISIEGKCG